MQDISHEKLLADEQEIQVKTASVTLNAIWGPARDSRGIVVFAHGAGSSRFSVRNRQVAALMRQANMSTLLMDLLTEAEEKVDITTHEFRFDIGLLAERIVYIADWLKNDKRTADMPIGFFGSSTGAASALIAASQRPEQIKALVSRGGRVDLAEAVIPEVKAPTLMIVGGNDPIVKQINESAAQKFNAEHELVTISGASHLFEEPGKLDEVAQQAKQWFLKYLN